jgi:alpha-galactosidase
MQHPKVVVLGAGSLFFGREAIWQMVYSPQLNTGTLGLVDTDGGRLAKMAALAEKVVAHTKVPLALEASTDRREVLKGADFVVLSFANDSVKYRDIDCQVSAKYGIRMCSGDTIGPGGIFRTLRELPSILAAAKDIESLCPKAWVINYINPTAAMGLALKRYAPRLKSFALCDGHRMPHVRRHHAVLAGIINDEKDYTDQIDRKFDLRIAGPNHFTWIIKAEYDGHSVMREIAESIRKQADAESEATSAGSKQKFNYTVTYALYEIFGAIPTTPAHTKEYVRFWQGLGKKPEPIGTLLLWNAPDRYKRHEEMWKMVDAFLTGKTPIDQYMTTFGPDHATDIIEAMCSGQEKLFYINTLNSGAVTNVGNDRFLELLCKVDSSGPRPLPVGDAPAGLRGLWAQVLDAHELAAEAAYSGKREILRRAMLTDPLVSSIADADALVEELLQAERDALPKCWF